MATTRRLWIPVLVGLLVAVLLGPAGVTAVEPRTVTASIMVPAAAFIPTTDDWEYFNNGNDLGMFTGYGIFTAPLSFPVSAVSIKKITLYALDNDVADICVTLYRSSPTAGTEIKTGEVCSSGESTTDPQALTTTAISPRQVNTALHGSYVWLQVFAPGIRFYGVKITYSY